MACVVSLVTSWATRRPQRWPGGVNLHILPRKLPFHWLSAAAGVSDMHRPASAWFPDMNEVQNGLCGASGHFLGHWTATTMAWGVNLHISPRKLPFHWLYTATGGAAAFVSWVYCPLLFLGGVECPSCQSGSRWAARGHPRGLRRVKLSQAGSIGGFNDQGGCGCAHPAVRLLPLVPWASGVPRVAHRGAVGIARDPPRFG